MILEKRLVTTAVKTFLANGSGKLTDVGNAPEGADLTKGYYVIHTIPGGGFLLEGESLVAPDETIDVVYQVDGVSSKYDGAEWLADRARHVFLARTASGAFQVQFNPPAGWACIDRRPDGGSAGVDVVGVRPNQVHTAVERFVLTLTPS